MISNDLKMPEPAKIEEIREPIVTVTDAAYDSLLPALGSDAATAAVTFGDADDDFDDAPRAKARARRATRTGSVPMERPVSAMKPRSARSSTGSSRPGATDFDMRRY